MRITLSVLLATLTIYCSSSALSLPPSLIATAASLGQHQTRQTRDNHGADVASDHLLLQPSAIPGTPSPQGWRTVRTRKDARFLRDARDIATNVYANTGEDTTSSDNIARLASFELNSNAGNALTHPNTVSGSKLVAAAAQNAHERRIGNGMAEFKRKLPVEYDLNALLASSAGRLDLQRNAAQPAQKQQQTRTAQWLEPQTQPADVAPRIRAMQMQEFFTPLKYWAHHCQLPDHNCPQKYYRALLADRSTAAAAAARQMDDYTASGAEDAVKAQATSAAAAVDDDDVNMNAHSFAFGGSGDPIGNFNDDGAVDNIYNQADAIADMASTDGGEDDDDNDADNNAGNDILMLLSGEQDVMKFLSWAMQHLYSYQHFANMSGNSGGAEHYHPGMFNWKKLNLSGNIEPPLVVEEPHYVIVRREQLEDDLQSGISTADRKSRHRNSPYQSIYNFNHGSQYKGDPFIPPRGRKHNLPDLDALLNRYETFVPNRGKRDKIKDIFKYDDLFFPNRGKKQKPPKATTSLALNDKWQRNCADESNEVTRIGNAGGVEERARWLANQVDGIDDSNLTVPPASVVMRRMLGGQEKHLRPHKLGWSLSESEAGGDHGGTIGISFDRNGDDNGNNYSDTIDNNLSADADNNGGWEDAATASLGRSQGIENSDSALTNNQINENDQSVKSSVPEIGVINTLTAVMAQRPSAIDAQEQQWRAALMDRMRRVAGTFAGATRIAANRWQSRQQPQRPTRQQLQDAQPQRILNEQQQPPSIAAQRYFNSRLRNEQLQKQQQKKQAQRRRAAWQLLLPSNQVRDNSNDLDRLSWRQLHQSNNPLIVQHPPMQQGAAQQQQMRQLQQQLQKHLLERVDGVAAGRIPPEAIDADRIYFNI